MASTLRHKLHTALADVSLSGKVLDLGGARSSAYHRFLGGTYEVTIVNIDEAAAPDVVHDLEKPLPFADASYDGVLLINVLEHIYEDEQLLSESHRVLASGGRIVITVPFLFPVHPSPHDFWRFTDEGLSHMLEKAGFSDVKVTPLGGGVFTAQAFLFERLLPPVLKLVYNSICTPLARLADVLFTRLARLLGKQYRPDDYPLGYLVTATKRD